jgi:hypothetical protein
VKFYDRWKRDLRYKIRSTLLGAFVLAILAVGQAAMAASSRFDLWVSAFLWCVALFSACGVARVLTVEIRDLRNEYRIAEECGRD